MLDKGARASIKVTLRDQNMSVRDDFEQLQLAAQKAGEVSHEVDDMDSAAAHALGTASQGIDAASSLTTKAQSTYDTAQTIGSCFQPIGQAVQYLGQIITVVDGRALRSGLSCAFTNPESP